ncbi:alkaline ceramidase ydc1 [Blastocladiella emersonii ATCC 22665]|nr:alkaline ceramidase ydc1 [Blastocladiella emersonii ATCC 22665]
MKFVDVHGTTRFDEDPGKVGVWGPVTSSVDFCEHNYAVTYYLAEFFNSISNLFLVLAGILLLRMSRKLGLKRRFDLAVGSLIVVGIGSFAFHATLLYGPQLLDELPMVYMSIMFVFIMVEHVVTPYFAHFPLALFITAILYSAAHAYFRFIIPFYLTCGLCIVISAIYALRCAKTDARVRLCLGLCALWFTFSIGVWIIDQEFCTAIEFLKLHAVWHVGIALTGSYWVAMGMYIQLRHLDECEDASIAFRYGFLPVVSRGEVEGVADKAGAAKKASASSA